MRNFLYLTALLVTAFAAVPVYAQDCDKCEDLCRLMDQYLQREKGIELWWQYALSNGDRESPTKGMSVSQQVWIDFQYWLKRRKVEDKLPCKLAPVQGQGAGKLVVDLETKTQDGPDCQITYQGKPLEGQTLDDYVKDTGCKPISDSTIEHEKVHQMICKKAYAEYMLHPEMAKQIQLQDPFYAESELQAWTRHKQVLEDAIRKIIQEKGCGWQPTKRQQNDPNSIPSRDQIKKMSERGWKAVDALSNTYAN